MTHEKDESRLDRTLKGYQSIRMDEEGKKELHERVMGSVRQPEKRQQRRWDMRPVFSFVMAGLLLVIGGYFLATEVIFSDKEKSLTVEEEAETGVEPGNGGVTPYTNLEKVASGKLGTEVHIPFHADVPLKVATIIKDGYIIDDEAHIGDPVYGIFIYSTLDAGEEEKEQEEELEKRYGGVFGDIIYGEPLVDDKHMVSLSIANGDTSHIDDINRRLIGEEKTIAGKTVYYSHRKESIPETFRISFRQDDDVYAFYFNTEKVTKDYAFAFVEKSLKQIQE